MATTSQLRSGGIRRGRTKGKTRSLKVWGPWGQQPMGSLRKSWSRQTEKPEGQRLRNQHQPLELLLCLDPSSRNMLESWGELLDSMFMRWPDEKVQVAKTFANVNAMVP